MEGGGGGGSFRKIVVFWNFMRGWWLPKNSVFALSDPNSKNSKKLEKLEKLKLEILRHSEGTLRRDTPEGHSLDSPETLPTWPAVRICQVVSSVFGSFGRSKLVLTRLWETWD